MCSLLFSLLNCTTLLKGHIWTLKIVHVNIQISSVSRTNKPVSVTKKCFAVFAQTPCWASFADFLRSHPTRNSDDFPSLLVMGVTARVTGLRSDRSDRRCGPLSTIVRLANSLSRDPSQTTPTRWSTHKHWWRTRLKSPLCNVSAKPALTWSDEDRVESRRTNKKAHGYEETGCIDDQSYRVTLRVLPLNASRMAFIRLASLSVLAWWRCVPSLSRRPSVTLQYKTKGKS